MGGAHGYAPKELTMLCRPWILGLNSFFKSKRYKKYSTFISPDTIGKYNARKSLTKKNIAKKISTVFVSDCKQKKCTGGRSDFYR